MTRGRVAAVGLPFPLLSSDSPVLRRGDEVRMSISFVRFAPPGPEPPFFPLLLLEHGSGATRTFGLACCLLHGELVFGRTLWGLDLEEGEHPISPRAGEFRLQKIILSPRHGTKDFVGAGLHLRGINLGKPKTKIMKPSKKNSCFF